MEGYYLMPHPPIMLPEVGKGREDEIIKTIEACKQIGEDIYSKNVDTIILITPHGTVFRDAVAIIGEEKISGDLSKFGVPEVHMELDINLPLTQDIIKEASEEKILVVSLDRKTSSLYGINIELDHGAIVPLYYVVRKKIYKLVHITYGMLSPVELYKFGIAIKKAVDNYDGKVALIASGDLSHRLTKEGPYPYSPLGDKFDCTLMELLKKGDIKGLFSIENNLVKEAGECGLRSLYIMAGAMDGSKVNGEILSYEGPFGVGYGVVNFHLEDGESIYKDIIKAKEVEHDRRTKEGNPYTKLARRNLDSYYNTGKSLDKKQIAEKELLDDKKGVFISLKINNELRGCIGTIDPVTQSVGEEIIRNSILAATEDPRFQKVTKEELLYIDISVDLLYKPEKADISMLNSKEYGVIVYNGYRRGLLLPNLEGVNTVEEQLNIALQKAGISPNETYNIERFKVERFKEVEVDE